MKNIKTLCRRIVAMAIAVAMVLGAVALLASMTGRSFAGEDYSEYNFKYKQLDVEFYKNMYPDIVLKVGSDPYALYNHYWEHGMAEGRIPYAGAQPGERIDGYIATSIDVTSDSTVSSQTGGDTATRDLSEWTPEQLAMLAQKQAEFDASSYVKVGWTEEQVQSAILNLKNVYPEGITVGICNIGKAKVLSGLYASELEYMVGYKTDYGMDMLLDKNNNRVLPIGFVECETRDRIKGNLNIRNIRVGDVIETVGTGSGHVAVVLSHDDKGITVVESNHGGDQKMHWGRRISWEELENGGNTIYKAANKCLKITSYKY